MHDEYTSTPMTLQRENVQLVAMAMIAVGLVRVARCACAVSRWLSCDRLVMGLMVVRAERICLIGLIHTRHSRREPTVGRTPEDIHFTATTASGNTSCVYTPCNKVIREQSGRLSSRHQVSGYS
jgi:hypothetical protein